MRGSKASKGLAFVGEMVCDSIERIEAVRVAFGSLLLTVRKWAAKASKVASYYRLHARAHV